MKKAKAFILLLTAVVMLFGLAACGSSAPKETADPPEAGSAAGPAEAVTAAAPESNPAEEPAEPEAPSDTASEDTAPADEHTPSHSDVLVAYFSATGTTKGVAEKIAAITGGDLYEIVPAEPYSDADLNWNDSGSRSTREQNDKSVRPGIGSEPLDLTGYKTVFIGFPIWWGEEPRIMDTFAESYDFDGMTLIPFCTSSSSGIGRSGPNMEALAGSGVWLEGKRFGGGVSEADLQSWIDGLN